MITESVVNTQYRNVGPRGAAIESATANLLARGPKGDKGDKGDDGGPNVVAVAYGDTWPPTNPSPNVLYLRLAP
jgi:hypothetical protein